VVYQKHSLIRWYDIIAVFHRTSYILVILKYVDNLGLEELGLDLVFGYMVGLQKVIIRVRNIGSALG